MLHHINIYMSLHNYLHIHIDTHIYSVAYN